MSKLKMLQFDLELNLKLGKKIIDWGYGAEPKKMFGHETWFVNGYMFCGANVRGVFVQLGKEAVDRALDNEAGVEPFSPREDMVMKDYLQLGEAIVGDDNLLKKWLDAGFDYLSKLPPKVKKAKKKR